MTTVCKTIIVTDQQDGRIKAQIQAGYYTNDSECIPDLIRCEQEQAAEMDAIRAALIEGENSGAPQIFDAVAFKQKMLSRHG